MRALLAAILCAPLGALSQVLINEVLPNPNNPFVEEWVELYNPSAVDADVSSFVVSDDHGFGASGAVELAGGSTVPAGGFLVVVLRTSDGYLNNGGDKAQLFDADGVLLDEVEW